MPCPAGYQVWDAAVYRTYAVYPVYSVQRPLQAYYTLLQGGLGGGSSCCCPLSPLYNYPGIGWVGCNVGLLGGLRPRGWTPQCPLLTAVPRNARFWPFVHGAWPRSGRGHPVYLQGCRGRVFECVHPCIVEKRQQNAPSKPAGKQQGQCPINVGAGGNRSPQLQRQGGFLLN